MEGMRHKKSSLLLSDVWTLVFVFELVSAPARFKDFGPTLSEDAEKETTKEPSSTETQNVDYRYDIIQERCFLLYFLHS